MWGDLRGAGLESADSAKRERQTTMRGTAGGGHGKERVRWETFERNIRESVWDRKTETEKRGRIEGGNEEEKEGERKEGKETEREKRETAPKWQSGAGKESWRQGRETETGDRHREGSMGAGKRRVPPSPASL